MIIERIVIENFRSIKHVDFPVNEDMNIFVGNNDSGKSTLLEAIAILTTGKISDYSLERQLKSNLFNNEIRQSYINSLENGKDIISPPRMFFEAYCIDSVEASQYKGTNNSLRENCPGIRIDVEFNKAHEDTYKRMLQEKEVFDIPVEFYTVQYRYFSGDSIVYRYCPIKAVFIDTTRKDYTHVVDRFVSENITTYLSQKEQIDLSVAYRKSRNDFHASELVERLNKNIKENVHIGEHSLSIDLKEERIDEWKRQMSVVVDDCIPFENIGFGTQNVIKIELAVKNTAEQVDLILMEEPENNLSFVNMASLIQRIVESRGKQIFISTHSSYTANKLDLSKVLLVRNGEVFSFTKLKSDTFDYFKKLPGYDTLRLILATEVILVEGITEELVVQKAFLDEYGKLPSYFGIDIITVNSLAFKRYCDIAMLLGKHISILTDNDGSIVENIKKKYTGYIDSEYLHFYHETDEKLQTFEPSIISANLQNGVLSESFRRAISKNGSMLKKNSTDVCAFMKNNKAEWALRVFDSNEKIRYPEYVKNAIKQYDSDVRRRIGENVENLQ